MVISGMFFASTSVHPHTPYAILLSRMNIASIKAYQVLDSRGEPTIRVRMESSSGNHARFDAPSGKSVSGMEAKERRDHEKAYFMGRGVTGNIDIIEKVIAPKFIGYPLGHLSDFDQLLIALDGTEDRSNLGTNTLTALSGAYFLLSCYEQGKEVWQVVADQLGTTPAMPRLYANLVAGGAHAPGLDLQEFMVVPKTNTITDAINNIYIVRKTIRAILANLYGPAVRLVSDEGAMAALGATPEVILEAFTQLANRPGAEHEIALDCAANHFFRDGKYILTNRMLDSKQLADIYLGWDRKFPLLSVEDPFMEQDMGGLKYLTTQPGRKALVIGDDITATDASRITDLTVQKLIDGVIIKPNQVGTLSETLTAIQAALQSGAKVIISHRSGESNDTLLPDLAYAVGAFGIKVGAPVRGERVAKYNRFFEIEKDNQLAASPQAAGSTVPSSLFPPASITPGSGSPAGKPPVIPAPGPLTGKIPSAPIPPSPAPMPSATPQVIPHHSEAEQAAHLLHRYETSNALANSIPDTPLGAVGMTQHTVPFNPSAAPAKPAFTPPPAAGSAPKPPKFRY